MQDVEQFSLHRHMETTDMQAKVPKRGKSLTRSDEGLPRTLPDNDRFASNLLIMMISWSKSRHSLYFFMLVAA